MLSTNYRAELTAVREATGLVSTDETQPSHAVFQTDSKPAIQSLLSSKEQLEGDTLNILNVLSQRSRAAVLWILAHSSLAGNEEADRLAKSDSRVKQPTHQFSVIREVIKALISRH